MTDLIVQITQSLAGLAAAVLVGLIGLVGSKATTWLAAHTDKQTADATSTLLQSLEQAADAAVKTLQQNVVDAAKQNGKWSPALAEEVKAEALEAAKSLISPAVLDAATKYVGDIDQVLSNLIEKKLVELKAVS